MKRFLFFAQFVALLLLTSPLPVAAQPDLQEGATRNYSVTKSLHVSPDGMYLVQLARKWWRQEKSFRYDPQGTSITLWELGSGRLKWRKFSRVNISFKGVFSADSKHFLVYGRYVQQQGMEIVKNQQQAEIWALETGEEPVSLVMDQLEMLWNLIFLPDGKSVMGLLNGEDHEGNVRALARLWDAGTGQHLRDVTNAPLLAQTADWTANTHILASATRQLLKNGKVENELIAWSLPELTSSGSVPMGTERAMKVTPSPDGKKVAYMIYDGKPAQKEIYLWDIESKEVSIIETPNLRLHHVINLEFSSDCRHLIGAGFFNDERRTWVNELWFWNTQTGALERSLNPNGDRTIFPHQFCLVPDGKSFISHTLQHKVEQRSLEDGSLIRTFTDKD